jgi:hypothetical protein
MPATIPGPRAGLHCLPTAYLQTLQPDNGSSHGFAFSPGLELRFGDILVR